MVHLGVERVAEPRAVRVLVVVEDDLLVQRVDAHEATPKYRLVCASPSISASISWGVV